MAAQAVEAEGPRRLTAGGRGLAVAVSQRAKELLSAGKPWELMRAADARKGSAGVALNTEYSDAAFCAPRSGCRQDMDIVLTNVL